MQFRRARAQWQECSPRPRHQQQDYPNFCVANGPKQLPYKAKEQMYELNNGSHQKW